MGFIDLQWDSIDFVSLPQLASCCFCGIFCYTCTFLACRVRTGAPRGEGRPLI